MSRHLHYGNQILARLPEAEKALLSPHLKRVDLGRNTIVHKFGEPFSAVYFPHDGIVSLVIDLSTGDTVETATVGREGVVGGAAGFGAVAVNRAVVQVGGSASMIHAGDFRPLLNRSPTFRDMVALYQHFILAQAQQCAVCNTRHPVEQRLARWLLRCRDLTDWTDIPFTHEFMADMLGVRRSSVSLVANTLQRAGLIDYRRGRVRLLNIEGLRASACECYGLINEISERLLLHRPGR